MNVKQIMVEIRQMCLTLCSLYVHNKYMKTVMADLHCKIPASLKRKAEAVFDKLGTNKTDAIRMFFAQVAMQQAIPFVVRIPNKATQEAIGEAVNKANSLEAFSNSEELFKSLDEDDE